MANELRPIVFEDEDGIEHSIPSKFDVCDNCDGKGSHVNRSIDGHGLSREDFDEDPDFADAYFAGAYDVPCDECKGLRVVPVIDEDAVDAAVLAAYYRHLDEEARYRAEDAAERRYFGY